MATFEAIDTVNYISGTASEHRYVGFESVTPAIGIWPYQTVDDPDSVFSSCPNVWSSIPKKALLQGHC